MSKPFTNPFFEADMSKVFDTSKFFDLSKTFDMSKMTGPCSIPQFDIEAAFALQRKNVEAFTALSQTAYENIQSLWRRQTDSCRQMMEELTQSMQATITSPTTEGKASKQAEVSKAALDKYMASLRDASETLAKCNSQVMETVSTRMNDSISELRGIVKKTDCAA